MDATAAFARAIRIAGSECKLAAAIGYSQVAVNKARRRGSVSPRMAAGGAPLHRRRRAGLRAAAGSVGAAARCPDRG
jgi:hypothetical protein